MSTVFDFSAFMLERAGRLRELFEVTKRKDGTRHPCGPFVAESVEGAFSVIFHTRETPESALRFIEAQIKYRHDNPHVVERFEVQEYGGEATAMEEAQ